MTVVKPYQSSESKKNQVHEMFNTISTEYDLLNTVLSFGIHHYWRKKCVNLLKPYRPKNILDLASGTGDLAISLVKLNPEKIIASDYAEKMLEIAQQKINHKNLNKIITTQVEDGENLSFPDNMFDAVTISFGIRNFENYQRGIENMYRVLKPGAVLLILEFTNPKSLIMKSVYGFYFKYILPLIARLFTKDKNAYGYLPKSVAAFPQYENFQKILESKGFSNCKYIPLTGGTATIYVGVKPL